MTLFSKTELDITCYKPRMKQAKSLDEVPWSFNGKRNVVVQVKADGESFIRF